MSPARSTADTERAVDGRLPGVLTEIRSLLDAPARAEQPPRAVVEDTLTNGYAYALALEGERAADRAATALAPARGAGPSARVRMEEIARADEVARRRRPGARGPPRAHSRRCARRRSSFISTSSVGGPAFPAGQGAG